MVNMSRLAFSILRTHWKVVLLMIFFFAVNVFSQLLINGYRDNTIRLFQTMDREYLIVHETDTYAEFYGSRISPQVGDQLKGLGCSLVVPVLHTATGTVGRDFQFVMGVDVNQYREVERFDLLAGQELTASDPSRSAMVGRILAERDDIQVGDTISLRGRDFHVIGIFETHGFYDNDVWISLEEAQTLLGWGTDVSYYIIPNEGILQAGNAYDDHTIISHQGESVSIAGNEILYPIELFNLIVTIVSIGTAISLGNVIFRLATLERYHMAILRSVGFSRGHISLSIITQAGIIFLAGFILGLTGALLFPSIYQITMYDMVIKPDLGFKNIIMPFFLLGGIGLISVAIPLTWVYRTNVGSLLRSE
jgi:ABC-type lipoprotein release transport system permease subunit